MDSYQLLSAQDRSFLDFETPGTPMHLAAVGIFEPGGRAAPGGRLDLEALRAYVASRLETLPRYRQRLAFSPLEGRALWVDDERFDPSQHVSSERLPAGAGESALKPLVGRLLSEPLDRRRPLWELRFVEGLPEGRFAMLLKVHHCMVDGIAGMALLSGLLRPDPDPGFEPPRAWVPHPRPTRYELLVDAFARGVRRPFDLIGTLAGAVRRPRPAARRLADGLRATGEALASGLRLVAATPLNRPISGDRRMDWCLLDLAQVKELRQLLGGSVNDVLLTLTSGALRSLLVERGVSLERLDYRVVVPVNVRESGDAAAGNQVSAWILSLPVAEPHPLRRHARVRAETERQKRSGAARGTDLFIRFADWSGSPLLTRGGARLVSLLHPYHLILSNVPGPDFPLHLLGARLSELHPALPLFAHQGLGVAALSYCGRVCLGVVADPALVPDLEHFTTAVSDSLAELRAAAG